MPDLQRLHEALLQRRILGDLPFSAHARAKGQHTLSDITHPDMFDRVLDHLEADELGKLSVVSREMRDVVRRAPHWRQHAGELLRLSPGTLPPLPRQETGMTRRYNPFFLLHRGMYLVQAKAQHAPQAGRDLTTLWFTEAYLQDHYPEVLRIAKHVSTVVHSATRTRSELETKASAEAIDSVFDVLEHSPYIAGFTLAAALILEAQEPWTPAMMALGAHLGLSSAATLGILVGAMVAIPVGCVALKILNEREARYRQARQDYEEALKTGCVQMVLRAYRRGMRNFTGWGDN